MHRLDMERKKFLGPKLQVLGLTVGEGQARALRTLLEEGTMTQKQLADLCMRDAATICLTEEGKEKAKQVQKIFRELDERIWGDIPEKEMEQLYETLLRIERNLE